MIHDNIFDIINNSSIYIYDIYFVMDYDYKTLNIPLWIILRILYLSWNRCSPYETYI
jgi:hypothetical protein